MKSRGTYSRFIPSIFKEAENEASFMERYLRIFELILTGIRNDEFKERYLFSWNKIPGNDSERFLEYLSRKFGINWVKTAKIEKINDDRTIKITGEKNFLSLRLNDKKTIAKLEIHNFGTYEFIAIVENDEVNIYEESDEDRFDMISCLFHPRFTFLFDKRDKTSIPRIEEEHNKRFRSFFSTGMDDFLIWFAGWMGLALKENWDLHTKREIIAKIIPLYRIRGTKKGLEEYLKIFTESDVEIIEELVSFQVGISSHIGKDTRLGGLPPNHFMININLPASDIESRKREILEEIINTEKPVHVSYNLNIKYV